MYLFSGPLLLYGDKALCKDERICNKSDAQIHLSNSSEVLDQCLAFSPALYNESLKASWGTESWV